MIPFGAVARVGERIRLLRKTLRRLRTPLTLERLAAIDDPACFAEEALIASGRHLALAVAFLREPLRREGTVAFLLCRVLDGFEDLAPQVTAAADLGDVVAYLTGADTRSAPRADRLMPRTESDRVECLLATRLPQLRDQFAALPADARARITALITRVATGMQSALGQRATGATPAYASYCDDVLGATVGYAYRLVSGEAPLDRSRRAVGRALQIANSLRDLESDYAAGRSPLEGDRGEIRDRLFFLAAIEAPLVSDLILDARFPMVSLARGAMAILATTTAAFYLREVGCTALPPSVSHYLKTATWVVVHPPSYRRMVAEIEQAIHETLSMRQGRAVSQRTATAVTITRQRLLERDVARSHPSVDGVNALASVASLTGFSLRLCHELPDARLTPELSFATAPLLLSDVLLVRAAQETGVLGAAVVGAFGDLVADLARQGAESRCSFDHAGDVAAFLGRQVALASDPNVSIAAVAGRRQRQLAQDAHRLDYH